MLHFSSFFVGCILMVYSSLSEVTVDFEGRWITRPPADREFPFAVLIFMSSSEDEICSGSLITLEWVLTAARCMYKGGNVVENDTSLVVYAGVDGNVQDQHVQRRVSKKLVIHNSGLNDYFSLALVQIDPFLPKYNNKVVSTLHFGVDQRFTKVERTCKSGSYGRIEWDKEIPPALKKTMNLIQPCNCSNSLREAFPESSTDQWMCGEYEYNIGECKGDFGAVLKCDDKDFLAVPINLVTFSDLRMCEISDKISKKCSQASTISVYTSVCKYLVWMNSYIPSVPVNRTSCDSPNSAAYQSFVHGSIMFICIFIYHYMQ
ncbi:alpha-fibrinogenase-like [Macrosteles quadrilineatus]|uniref:alpha-fibrinogenase-like n=1 Tax=Macrosteles quadrilineatus TaxID=74068 RepID=UPI0023E333BB|nr:alpha-fibrinogenase-like [Macrosteles quadrilineatus]